MCSDKFKFSEIDITTQEISNIKINNTHPTLKLPLTKNSIYKLVSLLFKYEKIKKFEIILNFVSGLEIKKINKNYINHDYVTDIITFPYIQEKYTVDGELIISLDKVKENARLFESSFIEELKRVIIHGCLHLTGYNDKEDTQIKEIREKEDTYLRKMK